MVETVDFIDVHHVLPQFPVWQPPDVQSFYEPIPNPDVPFIQSSWTMVCWTWHVHALYSTVEIEEQPDGFFLDSEKQMPHFPVWLPPDEPSYFNDEQEIPHPEIDRIDLPIWLPWRPIPHQDFYTDEPEFVTPDKYESPWQIPRGVYFLPEMFPQPLDPIPDNEPYLDQPILLPLPQPYFMPPHIPFHIDLPSPPPKCPPPCLRRPDRKC